MILLCGIPSETPLAMVAERLEKAGAAFVTLNQRQVGKCSIWFEVGDGGIKGELKIHDQTYPLNDFHAIYQRQMDYNYLHEIEREPAASPLREHYRRFHETLTRWLEIAPGRVVNRTVPMCSNGSKPYQAQLIREQGFRIPETLITNDPGLVREFWNQHGRVIYKSASGVRSIVQTLAESDLNRLENVRWCPTMFQAYVEGTEVRVHTIGEQVYATAISSEATDYRYAREQAGAAAELRAVELEEELTKRCLALARALDLEFAGIDLKITPEGKVFCFEVNPCPAYSYFEQSAQQPISEGLARRLMA